jgi:hypothetical protein
LIALLFSLKNNWIFGNALGALCRIARAATLVGGSNPLFLSPVSLLVMKTIKIFAAAACAFCLSTTAFAQTTPAAGTMQSGTTTSPSGTMQSGTMNSQTGTDRMQNGTMQNGTMQNGTMQNGSMNGKMDRKAKMNDRKGMKKTKTSTTTPSTTGTM